MTSKKAAGSKPLYGKAMNVYAIFIVLVTANMADCGDVESFVVTSSAIPTRGQTYQLTCTITGNKTEGNVVIIFNNQAVEICVCSFVHRSCLVGRIAYTCSISITDKLLVGIEKADIWAEGVYKCETVSRYKELNFKVYTLPTAVEFVNPFPEPINLWERGLKIECRTAECIYGEPTFTWYFKTTDAKRMQYLSQHGSPSQMPCTQPDVIYSNQLTIRQNTEDYNIGENAVRFQCELSYAGFNFSKTTTYTRDVQFAVKVSSVYIQDSQRNLTTGEMLTVTHGESITLTCTTGPSRPASTINWYINNNKQPATGIIFTFTPQNANHDGNVYCVAYNLQPEKNAVESQKPRMFVKVQVANVYIQTSSRNLTTEDVINVTQGEITTLTCITGTSRPDATISWYIGYKKQPKTGVNFIFIPQNSDNDKRVYCTAYNLQSETSAVVSESPKLYVKVQVVDVYITNSLKYLTTGEVLNVTLGEPITLMCSTGTSRPASTINWYIGNTKQSTTGTNFEMYPQNTNNDKDVYCTAYNLQPEKDAVVSQKPKLYVKVQVSKVTIRAGSSKLTTGDVLNVTEGESITITCTTGTSRPASTINWYIGDTKQSTIGTNFEFSPQNAHHDKDVYCTAHNLQVENAVVSHKPILYVKVKAARPLIVNATTFFDGDSYFVQCKSSPTRPPANMAWMLGGKTLTNTTIRHETENYELVHVISTAYLTASKPYHNAEITCQSWISGQVEKQDTSKTVTIFWRPVKPSVTAVNVFPWLEYREGELSCSSDDSGNPKSTITWISNAHVIHKEHRFRIGPLSYLDNNRTVQCKLENAFTLKYAETVISDEITLDIQYTPKIFLKDTVFATRTKENITVTIPFLTNPNFTSVKLLVDELSFNSSNHSISVEDYYMEKDLHGQKVNQKGYKLDFAIVDLQQNDFTTYMITLENEIGAANISFSITSDDKAKWAFPVGAAAGGGVGAAALIILGVSIFAVWVNRSNFTLTKGCKAGSQQRADDLRLTEQPYDSLSPERNSSSTYKKLTPLKHSDTQRSAACEYDDLESETTVKHIFTGLEAEAKAKSSTETVERQRVYENTRGMRQKDAVDKASEQNLGQKVAEPEAVYSNLMIRNA